MCHLKVAAVGVGGVFKVARGRGHAPNRPPPHDKALHLTLPPHVQLPNLANAKKKVKLVPIVSEAMNARAWEDAAQLLDMLEKQQSAGQAEVPKVGSGELGGD
jgi:hypothetical protein